MNEFCIRLLEALLRGGLALSVSAVCVVLFLRVFPIASTRMRRFLFVAVILQGCLLIRIPVTVFRPQPITRFQTANPLVTPDAEKSGFFPMRAFEFAGSLLTTEVVPISTATSRLTSQSGLGWAAALVLIWALGIVAYLVRSIWYYAQFLSSLPQAGKIPREWIDEWNALQRLSGATRMAIIRPTPNIGPLLCWHPRGYQLILPVDVWQLLEPCQRTMILRHELAHLGRGDIWKSFALGLLALPHWFNPLAWWMVKRFEDDAELACDDAVRQTNPADAVGYARTLLLLGGSRGNSFLMSQATGGRVLADRIRRLLVFNSRKDSNMKKLTIVTLVLGIGTLHLLRFQVRADEKPIAEPQSPKTGVALVINGASINGSETSVIGTVVFVAPNELAENKRSEAVIDMKQITANLLEVQQHREQLKTAIVGKEAQAKERQQSIQEARERAHKNGPDAELNDPEVTNQVAEFERWRKEVTKDLLRKEGEIYLDAYLKITAEVTQYAKENGIRVVRKIEPNYPLAPPPAVGRAQYYIWNAPVANRTNSSSAPPVNPIDVEKNTDGTSPTTAQVLTLNVASIENNGSGSGIYFVSAETSGLVKGSTKAKAVKYSATGNVVQTASDNNQNETSRARVLVQTSDGILTATEVIFQASAMQGVGSDGRSTSSSVENSASPDPNELLNRMRQNEIVYADRENEFDITNEILQRMNAKFTK